MESPVYLSAKEAAAELGVSLATLYAYVSRDLVRSEPVPNSRAHRYRAADVRALKTRRSLRTGAGSGDTENVLDFGAPVLASSITLIADGHLYYRGSDAIQLADTLSVEGAANLIWDCSVDPFGSDDFAALPPTYRAASRAVARLEPVERALALLPVAASADPAIYNMTDEGLALTGARLLRLLTSILSGEEQTSTPIDRVLARAWTIGDARSADLIRAALVLSADHELNASAFTVRCVAGTRAPLYATVIAGLAAVQGPRHGGVAGRVEGLLNDLAVARDVDQAVMLKLRQGENIAGFGHPLYPGGDPRGAKLLAMLEQSHGDDAEFRRAQAVIRIMQQAAGEHPNIDFAMATLRAVLRLPHGSALSLFALGRTIGWIGHAIEQYRDGAMIRPRARYVGPSPR